MAPENYSALGHCLMLLDGAWAASAALVRLHKPETDAIAAQQVGNGFGALAEVGASNSLRSGDLHLRDGPRRKRRKICPALARFAPRPGSCVLTTSAGMNSSWRRVIVGGIFFGLTCTVAVVGYMMAGWQMLDAVYMVVITVFGVGYGEAKPLDNSSLKVFTMGVIIAGCSSGIYVVGGFVQMLAEGEINRVLGTRRMSKGIEQLTGHTLICGYGRVGQIRAADLAAAHQPFVVIDTSESRVAEAQAAGYLALLGSASEERTLEVAGIARARVMAAVLPDDTANVFVTLTARDLNPTIQIIARAESPSTEKKLERFHGWSSAI
jgi:hypothetical protein